MPSALSSQVIVQKSGINQGKVSLVEPLSLINDRKAKFKSLTELGCSSKQAWAIAFNHHPRTYLTCEQLVQLGLN